MSDGVTEAGGKGVTTVVGEGWSIPRPRGGEDGREGGGGGKGVRKIYGGSGEEGGGGVPSQSIG